MEFAQSEKTQNSGATIAGVEARPLTSQSTAAPPNGSCSRRARVSRWVSPVASLLPAARRY